MLVEDSIEYPKLNGTVQIHEGDGVVVVRPHKARMTKMENYAFALTQDSRNGVCVRVNENDIMIAGEMTDKSVIQAKLVCNTGDVAPKMIPEVKGGIPDLKDGECKAFLTPGRAYKDNNGTRCKKDDVAFTVTKETDGIVQKEHGNLRIRYLTPRECLRLQAFPDDAIDRLQGVLSKSAMYKVAGNSIAVCCLKAIFKGIYVDKTFRKAKQCSLDDWF